MMTEPLVVVRVIGGPRCGERFATPLHGLTEGLHFRYIGHHYKFVRDAQSGRWGAIPSSTHQDAPRPTG
jgi:hypothetical protein